MGILAEGHGAGDIRHRRPTWLSKQVGSIGPEVQNRERGAGKRVGNGAVAGIRDSNRWGFTDFRLCMDQDRCPGKMASTSLAPQGAVPVGLSNDAQPGFLGNGEHRA